MNPQGSFFKFIISDSFKPKARYHLRKMTSLPLGSVIFRTVLAEIDKKYFKNMEVIEEEMNVEKTRCITDIKKRKHHKNSKYRQQSKVQWIDECGESPLAVEKRHCFRTESKQHLKPILKYRTNCLLS